MRSMSMRGWTRLRGAEDAELHHTLGKGKVTGPEGATRARTMVRGIGSDQARGL